MDKPQTQQSKGPATGNVVEMASPIGIQLPTKDE